jgi:hypothetical protein
MHIPDAAVDADNRIATLRNAFGTQHFTGEPHRVRSPGASGYDDAGNATYSASGARLVAPLMSGNRSPVLYGHTPIASQVRWIMSLNQVRLAPMRSAKSVAFEDGLASTMSKSFISSA